MERAEPTESRGCAGNRDYLPDKSGIAVCAKLGVSASMVDRVATAAVLASK